jgi:hypothetical protein
LEWQIRGFWENALRYVFDLHESKFWITSEAKAISNGGSIDMLIERFVGCNGGPNAPNAIKMRVMTCEVKKVPDNGDYAAKFEEALPQLESYCECSTNKKKNSKGFAMLIVGLMVKFYEFRESGVNLQTGMTTAVLTPMIFG